MYWIIPANHPSSVVHALLSPAPCVPALTPLHTCAPHTFRYRKAFYREYTDATFTQRVPQPPYQGVMGPLMVMEPGNLLRVILKVRERGKKGMAGRH